MTRPTRKQRCVPRASTIAVEPVGSDAAAGFRITASGLNARVPQAVPILLQGSSENGSIDAHAIQPFYAGLLARACGLKVELKSEGEVVLITAQ